MALPHAASGEVIRIHPLGDELAESVSTAMLKASQLEVMRMVLPAGKLVPEHQVQGELTIQCIEGAVELDCHGRTQTLRAYEMVFLEGNVPHALRAIENSSLLVTIVLAPDTTIGRP